MKFYPDFIIKYDPEVDTLQTLSEKVLNSLILRPLRYKKPRVIFIGGDSGEGKSIAALRIEQILLEIQGLDLRDYINDINIYQPMEYPTKIDRLLNDKSLKKVNIVCFHEAREIVKAKNWAGFLAQAVADVNAMSRSVKRLCTIIISQFIRDITTDVRYTLHYYCTAARPLGGHTRLTIYKMWKDDRDLEKPRLRKSRIKGLLVYPNGRRRVYMPKYLEITMPDKDIVKIFEEQDKEAKTKIIRAKLNKLIKDMKAELDLETDKVGAMVEWYSKRPDQLELIGHYVRGKFKLRPEVMSMHDLTKEDMLQFNRELTDKLKHLGLFSSDVGDQVTDTGGETQTGQSETIDTQETNSNSPPVTDKDGVV